MNGCCRIATAGANRTAVEILVGHKLPGVMDVYVAAEGMAEAMREAVELVPPAPWQQGGGVVGTFGERGTNDIG